MYFKTEEIRVDNLPKDIEEFKKAAVDKMVDPVNTAALFIFALNVYTENKDKGKQLLDFLVHDQESPISFDNILRNKNIAKSYLKGAEPNNEYTPIDPLTVVIRRDESRGLKRNLKTVYIGCGGTESYRPITLVRIKKRKLNIKSKYDLWFIHQYPSIILDVKEINK